MTTANKITIMRILLIPFFVVELIYYIETGNEIHHLLAVLLFAVTAILDGDQESGKCSQAVLHGLNRDRTDWNGAP